MAGSATLDFSHFFDHYALFVKTILNTHTNVVLSINALRFSVCVAVFFWCVCLVGGGGGGGRNKLG